MIRIGNRIEGVKYTKRPASYAIIEREDDEKIAIVTEGTNYFFLGGGIENIKNNYIKQSIESRKLKISHRQG